MTEKEKMIAALPYRASDPELVTLRRNVRLKLAAYNQASYDESTITGILNEILGERGEGSWIEPPFYCDYGFNIKTGKDFYMNFDCVILDVAPVTIGENVMCGPKVQILTA